LKYALFKANAQIKKDVEEAQRLRKAGEKKNNK
jgi:hypothetical protein